MITSTSILLDPNFAGDYNIDYTTTCANTFNNFEAYYAYHPLSKERRIIVRIPRVMLDMKRLATELKKFQLVHPSLSQIYGWYADIVYVYFF